MSNKTSIVLLGGQHDTTWFVYNALKDEFPIERVILELGDGSRKNFIQRRIKRLGLPTVIGQILFHMVCSKWLTRESKSRISEIKEQFHLEDKEAAPEKIIAVTSVNSDACRNALREAAPQVVIVNGTGIIGKKTLQSTDATYINTHVGITPEYRGVHGGYWALASDDSKNCGVTVHLVDTGIDTGNVLYQATISPEPRDNFKSYPYLQYAAAVPILKKAVSDALNGSLNPIHREGSSSKLWYHPTLWGYFKKRWLNGVK